MLPWNPDLDQDPESIAHLDPDYDENNKYYPVSRSVLAKIGSFSPITRFVRTLLGLLETGAARPYVKNLSELFRFLFDFAKLGNEETRFLLSVQTISTFVDFYLKAVKQTDVSI